MYTMTVLAKALSRMLLVSLGHIVADPSMTALTDLIRHRYPPNTQRVPRQGNLRYQHGRRER
jgi:hypothetical protein